MRTPVEIYEEYRIPPWLQMHQLRVAAVGRLLAERIPGAAVGDVVLTGLFHDMGNILKFDLSPSGPLAGLMGVENISHWQQVQDDFARVYGSDEHVATLAIAAEIGLSNPVIDCMRGISFSHMEHIWKEGPIELQISEYADMRVGPSGILPLRERVADLKKRSRRRWAEGHAKDMEEKFDSSTALLIRIEERLFKNMPLRPEGINDAAVVPVIEELKSYPI